MTSLPCPTGKSDCSHEFHAPDFVVAAKVHCMRYNKWLNGQSESCHRRDKGTEERRALANCRAAIHKAVLKSKVLDFYTAELLEWHRLNHDRLAGEGRRAHVRRGRYPSVDHFMGKGRLDYRICSGNVNHAKGALVFQQFVKLCRQVVSHHGKQAKTRKRKAQPALSVAPTPTP